MTLDGNAHMAWFRDFVSTARWRFAKTYVGSFPHEYTLQRWGDGADFPRAIDCIERGGVVEAFYSSRRKYLYVDDRKYWHMGNPTSARPEEWPTLINRTWLDVSKYRDEARALGHEGEALERLVERWKVLLAQARRESQR